jgi:serine/threonine protein kinase
VERQFLLTRLHPQLGKDPAGSSRLQSALKIYGELESNGQLDGSLRFTEQAAAAAGADAYVVFEFPGFADLRKLRAGMELLAKAEQREELWPATVALIGRALCSTLAKAHEHGLWHGLLTPAAIYIDPDGRVLLSELGLAQVLPASAWASDPAIKPFQSYLPKEVLAGTPAGPDCDVFAIGVLLGELLGKASGNEATKPLLDRLRPLLERASAAERAARPASMRELANAFDALPVSSPETVRTLLARIAQQFQFTGDTVPQPVTISERSSAEPLPPPPASRAGDAKVNLGASARVRASAPDDKSGERAAKARLRDISQISQPPRLAGRPPDDSISIVRNESEETPLPVSRPLLVTNPKIPANTETPARKPSGSATAVKLEESGPATSGDAKRARPTSKDDIRPAPRTRSGLEWLTSKSDQLAMEEAAKQTAEKASAQKVSAPSMPAVSRSAVNPTGRGSGPQGEKAVEPPPRSPTPPANAPVRRRSNPVSVNPRARGSGGSGSESATTPTAEVDAVAAQTELQVKETAGRPASADTLRGAAAAMALLADPLSVGETNPQLPPVKLFPAKSPTVGDEPTNPVSLEAVAQAAAAGPSPPAPSQPKRRSGPISEPNPRVLSSTAPAEIVAGPMGLEIAAPDVLASTGLAPMPPNAHTVSMETDRVTPRGSRTGLFLGGIGALALACGLVYLLLLSQASRLHSPKTNGDAGSEGPADGGTEAARIPADSLVLSSTPAATVLLDGESKGNTPLTLKVTGGEHKLVLLADAYTLLRRSVSGGNKLDLKLERAKLPDDVSGEASLKIKCKSEGKLRILVDGNDSGYNCPTDELKVSVGKHVLSFVDPVTDETKQKKIKAKKGKKPTKVKTKF